MITKSTRVLDYSYQLVRIFENFFIDYDTPETAEGVYDIIYLHRAETQDDFNGVIKYATNTTKFIIDITTESGNLQSFLDLFKILTDLYPYKFYLIVDSDISSYLSNTNVNYETIQGFEIMFYAFTNPHSDSIIKLTRKKDFKFSNGYMSFNGNLRIQRIMLLLELLKSGIDMETTSFLFYMNTPDGCKFLRDEYDIMLSSMKDSNLIDDTDFQILKTASVPKILDYDYTQPNANFNTLNNLYKYPLNFITENVTGMVNGDESQYGMITFTEKTIKPFLAHQIPMIFGVYGLNSKLRELGFDLFDDFINHSSYENIKNSKIRLSKMIIELKRVLELDILEYHTNNKNRFLNNYIKVYELANKGFDILNNFRKLTLL
jgi:hypothetical protein